MSHATGPRLDTDALDLLDAFRQQEQIPAAVHDRVWDRLADEVAAGPTSAARSARWARRGAVLGLLAAAAVAVLWLGGRALSADDTDSSSNQAGYDRATPAPEGVAERRDPEGSAATKLGAHGDHGADAEPSDSTEPSAQPVDAPTPPQTPPSEAAGDADPTPSASTPSRSKPERRTTAIPGPTTPTEEPEPAVSDTLAEENRLLSRARAALIAEQPERALTQLAEHARRFADGILAQEREALRAVALCEADRHDEGARAARAFLKAHPQAALARRVRSACLE
jgi:hypothetical protein